jgi:hypothetical protein
MPEAVAPNKGAVKIKQSKSLFCHSLIYIFSFLKMVSGINLIISMMYRQNHFV